ncbi:MAG TPA: hypothetical protein VHD90_21065 [Phototrophicaceae bacterium]|nr:hypothetical protein [Phototrophicaceae bacterium]
MQSRFEQARINQLISLYSPDDPPRLPLDFGDYLSLLWRLDTSATYPQREHYYRRSVQALGEALGLKTHPIYRLVDTTMAGEICGQLPNLAYRGSYRHVDAKDRKAALTQLIDLRCDTLRIGTYGEAWNGAWPGSGIQDTELRERVFAVLFTALQGQYSNFGRLLLVIDIVVANILFGFEELREIQLPQLISDYDFPDPRSERIRREFASSAQT